MTYEEACDAIVSKSEAIDEMIKHAWDGDDIARYPVDTYRDKVESDLVRFLGDQAEYKGSDVLDLLGY